MKTFVYSIALSFLIAPLHSAFSFSFQHSNCVLRIPEKNKNNDFLYKELLQKLKQKNFKAKTMSPEQKLFASEIYLDLKVERLKTKEMKRQKVHKGKIVSTEIFEKKLIFKECRVTASIKTSKGPVRSSTDKSLFEKSATSFYPRVTFNGDERCRKAIQDAFVHIPSCEVAK